jgi:hypothetical protein
MKNVSFKTVVAIITFVIGVVLVTFWVKSEPQQLTVSNSVIAMEDSEKYAVYSAVLNEIFVKEGYKSLIIFDKTFGSNSPEKVKPNFNLPVNYILADEEEFKNQLFADENDSKQKNKKTDVSDFIGKQPQPIANVRLSQVLFNEGKTTAEVEVEYVYCPLCGFGKTVSLEKLEGIWKIKKITQGWVS